jgi:hypothetical protein
MTRRSWIAAVLVAGGIAQAGPDAATTALEHALPRGWSLLVTDSELVIRHDRACFLAGDSTDAGHLINLELRYRLEPKWTAKQVADAKAENDKLTPEIAAARAKYQIDKIKVVSGKPAPASADERSRLAAFEKAEAAVRVRMKPVPMCSLGESSVFDGDDTYAQLKLKVDPAAAMDQARSVVEIVKKHCTPN